MQLFSGGNLNTSQQLANALMVPGQNTATYPAGTAPMADQYGNPVGSPPVLPTQGASGQTFDPNRLMPGLAGLGAQSAPRPIQPTKFGM